MALRGVRVLELAGLAPAPFCGMMLSDLGASVIRVDKANAPMSYDVTARGKRSIAIDLKDNRGTEILRTMSKNADVIIEPFRRGVMEKLQIGPDDLMKENPGLIYARLTGYGQHGSLADKAGHDINYLSVGGLLSRLGRKHEPPLPPINLLADFAGGGMICAMGIMAALLERSKTGKGQVIDSNMVEGANYVGSWIFKSQELFVWGRPRGENFLDSGAHFYETYATKDGKYMAVGAIEPQFYDRLLQGLGLTMEEAPQFSNFDQMKEKFRLIFKEKTRDEWSEIFKNLDACVTPVLELDEAPGFPHNNERKAFARNFKGKLDPIPAPRLSNHESSSHEVVARSEPLVGEHTAEILGENGYSGADIEKLIADGIVESASVKAKL